MFTAENNTSQAREGTESLCRSCILVFSDSRKQHIWARYTKIKLQTSFFYLQIVIMVNECLVSTAAGGKAVAI